MIVPRWQGFDPVEPGFSEGVFALKKFAFALCAAAAIAGYSQAGIFRKRVTTVTAVQAKLAAAQVKGDTSTAQGVALLIVQTGRFRHFGGYNGFEGIGMGLVLTKKLVERLGGTVCIEGQANNGCIVRLLLRSTNQD